MMTNTPTANTVTDTLSSLQSAHLPWVPWAMPAAYFKLLHADPVTEKFSLLIKVEANAPAPLHRHVGAVEGLVLEGRFHYDNDPTLEFTPGAYLYEPPGAIHRPISAEGAVMFLVFHGAIEGLDDAHNITGKINWQWHVKAWERALQATPLSVPSSVSATGTA